MSLWGGLLAKEAMEASVEAEKQPLFLQQQPRWPRQEEATVAFNSKNPMGKTSIRSDLFCQNLGKIEKRHQ